MKNLLRALPILLLALAVWRLAPGAATPDFSARVPDAPSVYRVYMALYRGLTNAERGFMDYLRDLKLPVEFIVRDANGDPQRIPAMRDEIRALAPDLVYSFGTTVTSALAGTVGQTDPRRHLVEFPILFNIVADPIGARLVTDLKTSGRNLTGTIHAVPIAAQYRTLREALSGQRLGILYNPQELNAALAVDALAQMAERDGMTVRRAPLQPPSERRDIRAALRTAIESLLGQGVDIVYLPSDSFVIEHARFIVGIVAAAGIPTFSATEDPIRSGGATMGLTSAYYNVGQFAGFKAMQILRDRRDPATIPIESIGRFAFVVNVDAARRIHRLPPISLLRVADLICYNEHDCQDTTAGVPLSESEPAATGACDPQQRGIPDAGSRSEIASERCANEPEISRPVAVPSLSRQRIRLVQQQLNARGFAAGRADGVLGPRTHDAIRRFQAAHTMETTGLIDSALLDHLQDRSP